MSLPIGWETRNNQMSEKDMKLGGDAANKFAGAKNAYSSQQGGTSSYQTSEQVKAFYMQQIEQQLVEQAQEEEDGRRNHAAVSTETTATTAATSSLPFGWEDRQKNMALQAKQFGVFTNKSDPVTATSQTIAQPSTVTKKTNTDATPDTAHTSPSTAEAALVQLATTTLNTMATTLEQNPVALSPEERAAFAAAMQRAMTAIAKCR